MAVKRTPAKAEKTTSARKPAARKKAAAVASPAPVPEHVAVRAYFLHLEGGHDPFENWLRAERELAQA
jgi:Protein of unknown function (DUF2934)